MKNIRFYTLLALLLMMGGSVMKAQILKLDSITIGDWYKCQYEYDDQSNCTLKTEYRYYNNGLHLSSIREYTYNELGFVTSLLTRDDALHKTDYYYNEQSLLAEEILSYYNGTNWEFLNKKTYEYNEDGKKSLFVEYEFKDGDWNEKERRTWEYEDDRPLVMITYIVGLLYEKKTYNYDNQGYCGEISTCYYHNEPIGQGVWIEYSKELFEYDAVGNKLAYIVLQKGMNSDELFYKEKKEYTYDNDNNCTHMDFYHSYDYDLGQWSNLISSFDYIYDYAVSINTITGFPSDCKEILDGFDLDVPVFNKLQQIIKNDYLGEVSQCYFYYSKWNALNESIENQLDVWPNPVSTTVFIDGVEFTEVLVSNALGQLVKKSKENVIDLSAQEAGTYILKVITPSGVVTKQIVKN